MKSRRMTRPYKNPDRRANSSKQNNGTVKSAVASPHVSTKKSTATTEDWRTFRKFVPMDSGTQLSGIRENLFKDRYSMKDETGQPMEQYPEQSWARVAWALSQIETTPAKQQEWEQKFYDAMTDFRFCPAGRFLSAAGTGTDTTMINCFVIPSPEDTRHGIIKTLEHVTEISARGGGVGFNLSTLRPRGSYLKSINGTSSGAVSWANLYSVAAHDIIQQGGTRRGALMIMLWDWHPDIEEFITVKHDMQKILGANLSVCISDDFMTAVENDADWALIYPETEHPEYRTSWDGDIQGWVERGLPTITHKTVKARQLWDQICSSAWGSAEPGVVFLDRTNKMNNTWYFEKNISTNPCGEQPLPAWGVCNLSSINLSPLVKDGQFDYQEFAELVKVGVRFLDNAVDGEKYLYPEIEQRQMDERRIGLGIIGLADALIKMEIRYGSPQSLQVIEKIFQTLRDTAYQYSVELAQEKGAFPKFDADKYLQSGFMQTMPEAIRSDIKQHGIRNALLITMAPTGKISLLAGVNSGIEPVFSFSYQQKDRLGVRTMYHPLYQQYIEEHGTDDIPDYFVVADDLTPVEHVQVQGLIQKYVDSAISKTVNAPETHSIQDVKDLYTQAYKLGCKGISYMREGSREGTLIRADKDKKAEKAAEADKPVKEIPHNWERPMIIAGSTYKMKTPVGTAFITVNRDEYGSPIETFINIGRAGSDVQAMAEAMGRVISKFLKQSSTASPTERAMIIIDQLRGIGGTRSVGFGPNRVMSLPDAVAKAMAMDMGLIGSGNQPADMPQANGKANGHSNHQIQLALNGNESVGLPMTQQLDEHMPSADICSECGIAGLVHEEGCAKCYSCGHSQC